MQNNTMNSGGSSIYTRWKGNNKNYRTTFGCLHIIHKSVHPLYYAQKAVWIKFKVHKIIYLF